MVTFDDGLIPERIPDHSDPESDHPNVPEPVSVEKVSYTRVLQEIRRDLQEIKNLRSGMPAEKGDLVRFLDENMGHNPSRTGDPTDTRNEKGTIFGKKPVLSRQTLGLGLFLGILLISGLFLVHTHRRSMTSVANSGIPKEDRSAFPLPASKNSSGPPGKPFPDPETSGSIPPSPVSLIKVLTLLSEINRKEDENSRILSDLSIKVQRLPEQSSGPAPVETMTSRQKTLIEEGRKLENLIRSWPVDPGRKEFLSLLGREEGR